MERTVGHIRFKPCTNHRRFQPQETAEVSQIIFGTCFGLCFFFFLQILTLICISGGYQDFSPGFYQVVAVIYLGMFEIQSRKLGNNIKPDNTKRSVCVYM